MTRLPTCLPRRLETFDVRMGLIELAHDQQREVEPHLLAAESLRRETVALDPVEEALVELARSALRNRREIAERRAKMAAVEGGKQGGRTT
jgi:hypothetical protein